MRRLHKAIPPADIEAIPLELRSIPRWVVWDYLDVGDGKKPKKVPLVAGGDVGAKYTNPAVWRSFEAVIEEAHRRGGLGVGFVFAEDDDIIGVDLDDAIAGGVLKPWAKEIFDRFATWAEKSPSGSGVHFVGRGDRVVGKTRVEVSETEGVERYSQGRWFTFSGDVMKTAPVGDVREAMAWLGERHFTPTTSATSERQREIRKANNPYAPDQDLDRELARVCLGYLKDPRAHDGEDWRRVGMALKATSDDLLEEWLSFSKRWPKCDEAECRDRWRRFAPVDVTVGTLVHMAAVDSGKTAVDFMREAKTRLGRDTGAASNTKKTAEEVDFDERLEAARYGVETSGVLCLVLASDPTLALYRETGLGKAGDVVAVPELTRVGWARISKAFPEARVQLVAGDLGDESFRKTCRALLETRAGPEKVVVIGPEGWAGEDDLPGWLDAHGHSDPYMVLTARARPAARWVADDALQAISPDSPDHLRREAVDRVLDSVAVCRGPRAALDVEDLLGRASEATGYSRESLEGLISEARERAETKRLRDTIGRELTGLAGEAVKGKVDPADLISRVRETIDEISSRTSIVPLPPAFDVEAVEREARLVQPGFTTGWDRLDDPMIRVRLRPKELIALAARPSQGKTSALVWLLWQMLEQVDDGAVVFVTHEETKISLLYRLYALAAAFLVPDETELSKFASSSRWNKGDVREWLAGNVDGTLRYGLSQEKIDLLARAKELVVEKARRLIVIEERGAGADRVAKLCRVINDSHGCRGVLLDYLQKLPHDGPDLAKGRRDLETAWACRRLREGIALPFECPVVIAAQVNREALRDGWARRLLAALDPPKTTGRTRSGDENGASDLEKRIRAVEHVLDEARPSPHMLRDGGIEHEADLILGTHNPAADLAWCKDKKALFVNVAWPTNPTPLDVGVLKNRNGTDGEWIRLVGDYGAGYFTSESASSTDSEPVGEVGTKTLEEWSPSQALDENPYG